MERDTLCLHSVLQVQTFSSLSPSFVINTLLVFRVTHCFFQSRIRCPWTSASDKEAIGQMLYSPGQHRERKMTFVYQYAPYSDPLSIESETL